MKAGKRETNGMLLITCAGSDPCVLTSVPLHQQQQIYRADCRSGGIAHSEAKTSTLNIQRHVLHIQTLFSQLHFSGTGFGT